MRRRQLAWFLLGLLCLGATARSSDVRDTGGGPHVRAVEPARAKPGDVAAATGDYLDRSRVAELYLTDYKIDLKAEILEQTEKSIKFKVPSDAAPGSYHVMILTSGRNPMLLEQPATLIVE